MPKYRVLVSDPISEQGLQALLDSPDVEVDIKTDLSPQELIAIIGDYDALLVRSQTKVTAEILQAAKKLRAIGRAGVGVDNIDVPASTRHGVVVINAPDGNTISTCEHTFAMMMAMARKIPQAHMKLKNGTWDRKSFVGVELKNKTIGILGFGRIGSEVAVRAKAFGMSVLAYDPFLTRERAESMGVRMSTVDEIVEGSDFITVHTPLTKDTKHLLSHDQFARMRDGVRILNCARGGIIDEKALVEALANGKVAAAALDVFEEEPPIGNPLVEMDNVVVTPHLGASTEEAQINVAIDVAKELLNILQGLPFRNAVNLPSLSNDSLRTLEPYLTLAEKLGTLAANLAIDSVRKIEVTFYGPLAEQQTEPVTRSFLKGMLSYYHGEEVNYVNAPFLAEQSQIQLKETKSSRHDTYTELLKVSVVTENTTIIVAGTHKATVGPRIVQIGDFKLDLEPNGTLLLAENRDKPGMIGKVGTILGGAGVNIDSMKVGKLDNGISLMVLAVDRAPDEETRREIEVVDGIFSVRDVTL
ncbi:phosphoglycerate dehydrogenase [Tumebacillus permanentifrigoris]|uniref:D-3-phosphoglycerate dehydrogenase n=1 Tax=Tumebacillus permanentifrigoris TaxID=378543 RepID=A0A316DX43_9BACL|nr:phosphoglycerate dehydrogenase [Tumebacillus permanentifrigoris]PWK14414.1 D-3-phosphoglycerate dehydrogenase [Tumebacillus permanentifrigoris]